MSIFKSLYGLLDKLIGSPNWEHETHIVVAGDTLTGIAQKKLGDARRYREIAAMNYINPPYTIYPGQELTLPDTKSAGPKKKV